MSLIKLRHSLLAKRINLHLALGGSFDAAPAASCGALEERLDERRSPKDQGFTSQEDGGTRLERTLGNL